MAWCLLQLRCCAFAHHCWAVLSLFLVCCFLGKRNIAVHAHGCCCLASSLSRSGQQLAWVCDVAAVQPHRQAHACWPGGGTQVGGSREQGWGWLQSGLCVCAAGCRAWIDAAAPQWCLPSPGPATSPCCSAAMTAFYLWNLLLFKPNLPAPKQQ